MDTNKIFIDMARRAHEFAEMCWRMAKEAEQKTDPEAWREENIKKQAAGVKFEKIGQGGLVWLPYVGGFENGIKEDYREVPQEVQKEGDMRIPEASEIRKWADRYYSLWCFVENSLPRDASSDTFDIFRGYARQVNDEIYGVTDKAKEPHAAERALWKAQREAGTNDVWQFYTYANYWQDIAEGAEPLWREGTEYRVKPKPAKLTAKIVRRKDMPFDLFKMQEQEWEFYGTPEECRAECEKYGYAILSEIKEVKPKTVKYYFALMKNSAGEISVEWCDENNLSTLKKMGSGWSGHTIIGDIEEREVEA